jgi:hypothetical protein
MPSDEEVFVMREEERKQKLEVSFFFKLVCMRIPDT